MIIAETGSMSYWRKGTGQVIYFLKNVPFFPIRTARPNHPGTTGFFRRFSYKRFAQDCQYNSVLSFPNDCISASLAPLRYVLSNKPTGTQPPSGFTTELSAATPSRTADRSLESDRARLILWKTLFRLITPSYRFITKRTPS